MPKPQAVDGYDEKKRIDAGQMGTPLRRKIVLKILRNFLGFPSSLPKEGGEER